MAGAGQATRWSRGVGSWKRRGLLAGLAGVVAGVLAQESERPAEDGHNGAVGANPLHLGLNNTNDTNVITTVTASVANGFTFRVDNNGTNGSGIVGEGTGLGNGVRGAATGAAGVLGAASALGVLGECTSTTGLGVRGNSSKSACSVRPGPNPASIASGFEPAAGVIGIGEFIGGLGRATITTGSRHGLTGRVSGSAPFGIGVDAQAPDGAIGVRGMSGTNTIDPDVKIGVQGISQQVGGVGVRGDGGDVGVKGSSQKVGVQGIGVTATDAVGVRGEAPGTGVFGTSTSGGGVAGASTSGIGVFGSTYLRDGRAVRGAGAGPGRLHRDRCQVGRRAAAGRHARADVCDGVPGLVAGRLRRGPAHRRLPQGADRPEVRLNR